ncbi:MAG: M24 family metallopeptidase, partial [Betaproteobacteria bacterium]|nr:M24 family metallopeptidase [Betaproteobacteria bacterium]
FRFYYSAKQFASIPEFQNYGKRVRDLLQEYVAAANGKIVLQVIEPEPFSDAEDQAVGYGIEQLPINATGEVGYLGLVGTNMTDKEAPIAFLNPERADALEYEITKLIYALANPKKRSVGVISDLSIMGGKPDERGNPAPAWTSIHMLQEFFDLKTLPRDLSTIDADIDTLLVVHPKDLPKQTLYAIDQFVLRGGKALVFVDPLAEEDRPEPDPRNPMVMPKTDSNLAPLFEAWGVSFATDKVVADAEAAVRVIAEGLLDLGLVPKAPIDEVIAQGQYRRFYMHRTGHYLGMDVHDVGDYTLPLAERMVLTLEPGLYVQPAADIPEAFWNVGIRIEDDAVVQAQGSRLLTRGVPVDADAIEALMRQGH